MDDELARYVVLVVMLGAALAAALGGYLYPVAGKWRDGRTVVVLRQRLFRLRGEARIDNGMQLFVGTIFFGRVRLSRHDFGQRHLINLGFTASQAKELEGARTGLFALRRERDDVLSGSFVGTHFTFGNRGARDLGFGAPSPRRWVRVDSEAEREHLAATGGPTSGDVAPGPAAPPLAPARGPKTP